MIIYTAAAASGLLLAAATFSSLPVIQLISLFAMIPVLLVMVSGTVKSGRSYFLLGVVFYGAWILPTTYWYYSFMNPLVAVAASVGSVLLFANLFNFFKLRTKLPDYIVLLIFCAAWALFTFLRLRLPVTKDWWIPHLGYAVWRNPTILQAGTFGGEAGMEFAVLLFASLCVFLIKRQKRLITVSICAAVIAIVFIFNGFLSRTPAGGLPVIITVQSSTPEKNTDATAQVVQKIKRQTEEALNSLEKARGKEIFAVWPENRIPPAYQKELSAFSRDNSINLIYHSYEPISGTDSPYKIILWLGPDGETMLENSKKHIAPGEKGTLRESANVRDGKTAYICYDVHYTDIVPRMHGASLVFVALNDEEFGDLEKTFHLADMALRAVQARAWIAASSKDGPTAIINPNGSVRQSLPYHQDGVIIIPL